MTPARCDLGYLFIPGNLHGLPPYIDELPNPKPAISSAGRYFTWSLGCWEESKFLLNFDTNEGCVSFDGEQDKADLSCRSCGGASGCSHLTDVAMAVIGAKALSMLLEVDQILSRDLVDHWCSKELTAPELALIEAELPFFLSLDPSDRIRVGRAGAAFAKAARDTRNLTANGARQRGSTGGSASCLTSCRSEPRFSLSGTEELGSSTAPDHGSGRSTRSSTKQHQSH